MYVLKFQSSDQLHFFWFQVCPIMIVFALHLSVCQDPNTDQDVNNVAKINDLLKDTNPQPPDTSEPPTENTTTNPAQTAPAGPLNQAQLNSFVQELMRGLQRGNTRAGVAPDLALTDILTPSVLASILQDPKSTESLAPFLPPDLLSPTSPVAHLPRQEMLQQIVASAPFRASVHSLDQALSTGLLGGLVTSLGMPMEAGLGVHPFLEAVQAQATRTNQPEQDENQGDEHMND
ncbi:hypothetical protein FRC12_024268 [Ceratobasidium sp. 428]|nr:hypothetical protein FRC12_024268 [Ceratobasidium sp. 428]